MNIISIIQTALTALQSDAELFLLERARAENEELDHEGDIIVIYPDWTSSNEFNQALEISTNRTYNIDFKTPDEWDNSDDNLPTAYESLTSADRIENMEKLANSIFWYIANNNDLWPEINRRPTWRVRNPILRANNGTMSGVSIQLTINFKGEKVCQY